MNDDLLEIFERVELATGRIAHFQKLCEQYAASHIEALCEVRTEQSAGFPKSYRLTVTAHAPISTGIKTEAGIIAHELRSSLDSLACALAIRNAGEAGENTYFPISKTAEIFETDGRRKIKRLSFADQEKIANLKPYAGGHPTLYQLHQVDKMRKHQRLTAQANAARSLAIAGGAIVIGAHGSGTIRGGWVDGEPLGEISFPRRPHHLTIGTPVLLAEGTDGPPDMTPDITLVWEEPSEVAGLSVIGSLSAFSRAVTDIVRLFG